MEISRQKLLEQRNAYFHENHGKKIEAALTSYFQARRALPSLMPYGPEMTAKIAELRKEFEAIEADEYKKFEDFCNTIILLQGEK